MFLRGANGVHATDASVVALLHVDKAHHLRDFAPMAARGMRTLVLADEPRMEPIAQCIAQSDPDAVILRGKPDEAIETVDRLRPEVVLIATDRPVLRALRDRHAELPIVALVQDGESTFGERALDQGATDVVCERELEPHLLGWRLRVAVDRHESEQRLHEEKEHAESASAHKSEFLSSMSHEIRTPLNTVLGMAELLGETALDDKQRGYLSTLQRAGDHVLALIENVLDIARIEAGTVTMDDVGFDLYEVAESAIELVRVQARRKKLEIGWSVGLDVPRELRGDPRRLRQVLVNLLNNAVKFTEKGRVWLSISRDKDEAESEGTARLRFSVTDTGIGIPKEKQQSIFTGFVQADRSIAQRFGGFGLGLNITKRIVDGMSGRIWIDSEPGRGSTFHVAAALPLEHGVVTRPFAEPKTGAVKIVAPNDRRLRVLVVDDSEDNRVLLGEYLRGADVDVDFAGDGETAIQKSTTEPFDAIFMDLQMPQLDGYETTRELLRRCRESNRKAPPVIALSAHVLAESFARSRDAGCAMQLTKPIRKRALLEALARATGSRIAEQGRPAKGGVRAEILPLLPKFFANRRNDVRVLREAIERKDLRTIATLAHNMRGTGASYGFPEISRIGDLLQEAGKRGEEADIARLVGDLEALLDELEARYPEAGAQASSQKHPLSSTRVRVQTTAPEPPESTGTARR